VWGRLYHPQFGILNCFIGLINLPPQSWLGDERWAMAAQVFLSTWRWTGYYAVILVVALQSVPKEFE
jgi:multiple sugar transport system permease protein